METQKGRGELLFLSYSWDSFEDLEASPLPTSLWPAIARECTLRAISWSGVSAQNLRALGLVEIKPRVGASGQ